MKRIIAVLALIFVLVTGVFINVALAATYSGQIDLLQVKTSYTRFYVQSESLSLFADGDFQEVLMKAFFQKSDVYVTYTEITCPGGITGTCGEVYYMYVRSNDF